MILSSLTKLVMKGYVGFTFNFPIKSLRLAASTNKSSIDNLNSQQIRHQKIEDNDSNIIGVQYTNETIHVNRNRNERNLFSQKHNRKLQNYQKVQHDNSIDLPILQQYNQNESNSTEIQKHKKKQERNTFFNANRQQQIQMIQNLRQKQMIKDMAMLCEWMGQNDRLRRTWRRLQKAFLSLMKPTQDPNKIKIYIRFLNTVIKYKMSTRSYQKQLIQLLTHTTANQFITIVVFISYFGMSLQSINTIQKLQKKRKQQFNSQLHKQLKSILAKNRQKINLALIQQNQERQNTESKQIIDSSGTPILQKNKQNQKKLIPAWKKGIQSTFQYDFFFKLNQDQQLSLIQEFKQKQMIKQLSILCRQMSLTNNKSDVIWCGVQDAFISLLKPTQNQELIRSYGKLIYSLAKNRRATKSYETSMALLLPFAGPKSFTQIISALSRIGGMSQQFIHIVQKLYYKRKQQFNPLQLNLLNYVLAKNNCKIDPTLIENLNSFPLKSIVLMLRSYDQSKLITSEILKKCCPAIIARCNETNQFDLASLLKIYFKYQYLNNQQLLDYFYTSYKILSFNLSQQNFQNIWQYFPQVCNLNKLPILLVEQIIKTLKILRFKHMMVNTIWIKISSTFKRNQKKFSEILFNCARRTKQTNIDNKNARNGASYVFLFFFIISLQYFKYFYLSFYFISSLTYCKLI